MAALCPLLEGEDMLPSIRSCVFLLPVIATTGIAARADTILPTITTNITIVEDTKETIDTATVTQRVGTGPLVGGAAIIAADNIHFTFPFKMTVNPNIATRFSLQDILNIAFSTTNPGFHPHALDGGDPISYAANKGTPIGAFSSDLDTDDSGKEVETDTIGATFSVPKTKTTFFIQSYVVNYTVTSPAEHGKPGEIPEPASAVLVLLGIAGLHLAHRKTTSLDRELKNVNRSAAITMPRSPGEAETRAMSSQTAN